jgi:hypothetical protein
MRRFLYMSISFAAGCNCIMSSWREMSSRRQLAPRGYNWLQLSPRGYYSVQSFAVMSSRLQSTLRSRERSCARYPAAVHYCCCHWEWIPPCCHNCCLTAPRQQGLHRAPTQLRFGVTLQHSFFVPHLQRQGLWCVKMSRADVGCMSTAFARKGHFARRCTTVHASYIARRGTIVLGPLCAQNELSLPLSILRIMLHYYWTTSGCT